MAISAEVTSLQESMDILHKQLTDQIEQARELGNEQMLADLTLQRALAPAWARWLKEEAPHKSEQIIKATCYSMAMILMEVIVNSAKAKEPYEPLAMGMIGLITDELKFNIDHLEQALPLPGFRRQDS